jgi:hypothetical protein
MKIQTTYGQLIKFNNTIENWRVTGDLFYFLLNGKIKDFWKNNKERVQTILDAQVEFDKQFFMWDETGFLWEGKGDDKKALLKEGIHIDDYKMAAKHFLETFTVMEL